MLQFATGSGATANKKANLFGYKTDLFWAKQWVQIISENNLSVIFDKTQFICKIAGYVWDTHKLTALAGLS